MESTYTFNPEDIESLYSIEENNCFSCSIDDKKCPATTYCPRCEEFLCLTCTVKHKSRKAFKDHEPIAIEKYKKVLDCNTYVCTVCKYGGVNRNAELTCKICEEDLCKSCSDEHRRRKATKTHSLFPISDKIKRDLEVSQIICTNCKEDGSEIKAEFFCAECEENLCEACKKKHEVRKATKNHAITSIRELANEKLYIQFTCDLCYNGQEVRPAKLFCYECDEYMCTDCSKKHQTRKATKCHKIKICCPNEGYVCVQCQNGVANISAFYCSHCFYHFCQACARTHISTRGTDSHKMVITQTFLEMAKEGKQCTTCRVQDEDQAAVSFCKDCYGNFCESCEKKHDSKVKGHILEILEQDKYNPLRANTQQILCDICQNQNIAVICCKVCPVNLCKPCQHIHQNQKASRGHVLVNPAGKLITQDLNRKYCSRCSGKTLASDFCNTCDEYLCQYCTKSHSHSGSLKHNNLLQIECTKDTEIGHIAPLQKENAYGDFPTIPAPTEMNTPTTNTITICWKEPAATHLLLDSYEVRFRKAIIQGHWNSEILQTKENSCTINNLSPGTSYEFQVRAKYCSEGEEVYCSYSDSSSHILTKQIALGKPKAVEKLGDKITIEWDTPASDKTVLNYEIRYRKIGDTKWKVDVTDDQVQKATICGLQGNTKYEFKVRAVFETEEGLYGPVSDQISTKTSDPGKPNCITKATDSITLSWKRPECGNLSIKHYDIRYRRLGDDKWNVTSTINDSNETSTVTELNGSSKYEFQIRAVYEDFEGSYGPTSDHIETETTLARKIKHFATIKPGSLNDGQPEVYTIPIALDEDSVNHKAKFRRCVFGEESRSCETEKTILVVGATGSGKSTLIEGMINYIFDVSWEDEFRFSLINLTKEEKDKCGNQALSQTEWITSYRINYIKGSQIYYTLNIIDTPGFGDTRGITRDKRIVDQMTELFSTKRNGIATIDAICFVAQAPNGRLSPTQKYIFESILSLFGKDIAENILILITFADVNTPPVLSALKAAKVPFVEKFVFNNSALFASKNEDFAKTFWNMGKESFKKFFEYLYKTNAKSLVMTADVLKERRNLEGNIQCLRPQIIEGLRKLEILRQTRKALLQHKTDIEANKNFEYDVTETHQNQINLEPGIYTTNCLTCNRTCHFPCNIQNDTDKSRCAAMADGKCKICPNKCNWDLHKNNPYRFEFYTKKVKKTYDELKQKYETATGQAETSLQIFNSIKKDFVKLRKKVGNMVQEVRKSLNRLSVIALKPNPLTDCEYIDLLIQTEKQEAKEGWLERVAMLSNLRKDAEQIQQVSVDGFEPWKDVDFDDLDAEFQEISKEKTKQTKTQKFWNFLEFKSQT